MHDSYPIQRQSVHHTQQPIMRTKHMTPLEKSIIKTANQDDAEAQYNLGYSYYTGNSVYKDYSEAVKWFQKSAEQGHPLAQYMMGQCYDNGFGVKQDEKKEVEWYRKAAEQGVTEAQYNLAVCHILGHGVEQDYVQANMWLNIAVANGITDESKLSQMLKAKMSPEQIAESEQLAEEWMAKKQTQ